MNSINTDNSIAPVEFITNDFKISLLGYPAWEASIAAAETDWWVKAIPEIDIVKRVIYRPTPRKSPGITDKNILIISDLKKPLQPYYNEMINRFFGSIPPNIYEVVSKFKDSHWDFIKAINLLGDDLLILIKNNPILAYVIVNLDKINKSFICYTNLEILQWMIRTKHRGILKLAGYPEAERMVKIFAKMEPTSITAQDLIDLRNVLMIQSEITEQILKLLSFAKTINKRLVRLITISYSLLAKMTHKLAFEIVSSKKYNKILKSLFEISYCTKRLGKQTPNLSSLKSIERLNVRLKEELRAKKKKDAIFPKQPLKDNCFVQAICTESELNIWATSQHNCIRNYTKKVHNGRCYFYRVIYNNEEATLELKLNGKKVGRGELSGQCNCKVSPELKKVVDEWLKENRGK